MTFYLNPLADWDTKNKADAKNIALINKKQYKLSDSKSLKERIEVLSLLVKFQKKEIENLKIQLETQQYKCHNEESEGIPSGNLKNINPTLSKSNLPVISEEV